MMLENQISHDLQQEDIPVTTNAQKTGRNKRSAINATKD
jgi:hypothetical protein